MFDKDYGTVLISMIFCDSAELKIIFWFYFSFYVSSQNRLLGGSINSPRKFALYIHNNKWIFNKLFSQFLNLFLITYPLL